MHNSDNHEDNNPNDIIIKIIGNNNVTNIILLSPGATITS